MIYYGLFTTVLCLVVNFFYLNFLLCAEFNFGAEMVVHSVLASFGSGAALDMEN